MLTFGTLEHPVGMTHAFLWIIVVSEYILMYFTQIRSVNKQHFMEWDFCCFVFSSFVMFAFQTLFAGGSENHVNCLNQQRLKSKNNPHNKKSQL